MKKLFLVVVLFNSFTLWCQEEYRDYSKFKSSTHEKGFYVIKRDLRQNEMLYIQNVLDIIKFQEGLISLTDEICKGGRYDKEVDILSRNIFSLREENRKLMSFVDNKDDLEVVVSIDNRHSERDYLINLEAIISLYEKLIHVNGLLCSGSLNKKLLKEQKNVKRELKKLL